MSKLRDDIKEYTLNKSKKSKCFKEKVLYDFAGYIQDNNLNWLNRDRILEAIDMYLNPDVKQ